MKKFQIQTTEPNFTEAGSLHLQALIIDSINLVMIIVILELVILQIRRPMLQKFSTLMAGQNLEEFLTLLMEAMRESQNG
jgi:hypothetical protein